VATESVKSYDAQRAARTQTRQATSTGSIATLTVPLLTLPARDRMLPHLFGENGVNPLVCCRALAIVTTALVYAAPAWGQGRVRERHDFDDPEGRLIGFYSAALFFSPLGAPERGTTWALDAGLEVTYVPQLSKSQRTAFQDKPEATNLAPVLPRPRVSLVLPGALHAQLSWVPPMRVFDVEANLFSVAVTRALEPRGTTIAPRFVATWGKVRGSITCFEDLLRGTQNEAVYFTEICNSRTSDDHFKPQHLAAEVLVSRAVSRLPFLPYAGIGVLREKTIFDIGVLRTDGSRDPDHPILELRATRPYGFLGGTVNAWRSTRFTGELFYAPGSLFTARVFAGIHLHKETGDAR
jgi:hypothetical protein